MVSLNRQSLLTVQLYVQHAIACMTKAAD